MELRSPNRFRDNWFGIVFKLYFPDTDLGFNVSIIDDDENLDSYEFISPPSTPSSCTHSGHHLVVSGGATAPTSPPTVIPFGSIPIRTIAPPHRIFQLSSPYPFFIDAFARVVPGHLFWLWHRAGVG
ncbi:hypothetical protein CYMTET_32082 [Cymbomonas tetramitiformis]|uniref:Uncharacterized protein n=1 Tax=Cymbomonas tetramitiformis TaxID=36881 RepID=A0AAE0FFQ1_9CHLO|nr:hypothetical protein CYMTET_32082 [Cymbomonas tetramitiformis]